MTALIRTIPRISAILAVFVLLSTAEPAGAQFLVEGSWTAHFLTPGGEVASATYRVLRAGKELIAEMQSGHRHVSFVDYELQGGVLTFKMDAGFLMNCRLEQQPTRQYKGSCLDEEGNVGPAVIGPPGIPTGPGDLDLDEAFDVWGLSRDEYERKLAEKRGTAKPPPIAEPDPLPMQTVDLNGHSLNVVDVGEGDVTVVLESGVGDDHSVWAQVLEAVAEQTRVVAYDRPGLGRSDATSGPKTPDNLARGLHSMLRARGVEPPYVLVGHEAGTLTVGRFQSLYPDEVAGLVFIEPAHPKEQEMWAHLDSLSWRNYLDRKHTLFSTISEPAASELKAYEEALVSGDGRAFEAPLNMPIFVVTGVRPSESPSWFGETPEGVRAKEELYRTIAAAIGAEFISSGVSGKYVQMEDPSIIVEVISKILDNIRE